MAHVDYFNFIIPSTKCNVTVKIIYDTSVDYISVILKNNDTNKYYERRIYGTDPMLKYLSLNLNNMHNMLKNFFTPKEDNDNNEMYVEINYLKIENMIYNYGLNKDAYALKIRLYNDPELYDNEISFSMEFDLLLLNTDSITDF